ncbi:biotin--[acetyl-CoA-carboxylase] ligase [Actinomycetota bacterium]
MRVRLDHRSIDEALLTSSSPWTSVQVHDRIGSTNAAAAQTGTWSVHVTDDQVAGRGRLGRSWVAPAGSSLAISAVLPTPDPADIGWLPLLTGLAMHRALAAETGLATVLKWPNDVLAPADAERKLCGILCELTPAGVVVGTGLNVDQSREELPVPTATSLVLCGVEDVDRTRLLAAYLTELHRAYAALVTGGAAREGELAAYRLVCATVGREVELHLPGEEATTRARATGIDPDGRLAVTSADGPRSLAAGDVVHVRGAGAPGIG